MSVAENFFKELEIVFAHVAGGLCSLGRYADSTGRGESCAGMIFVPFNILRWNNQRCYNLGSLKGGLLINHSTTCPTLPARIANNQPRLCSTTQPATQFAPSVVWFWSLIPSTRPPSGESSPMSQPTTTQSVLVVRRIHSWSTPASPLSFQTLMDPLLTSVLPLWDDGKPWANPDRSIIQSFKTIATMSDRVFGFLFL
ncbi:hypothetical protein F3Y22_tig00110299pilonHSYRG00288 [Hibiscus syriacus]|uniref:Uncharacterized protein n=1 Tax=Hibiscus syriacus TaxID=106335 RepID=A0A6A3B630_HIBSY|nr:hypothetical protein F3Y22_tig00110299pilonHSYRG00288 [Hibiscus syriacus]